VRSAVAIAAHYRPLSAGEQAFVLARHWPHLETGGFGCHRSDIDSFLRL
jgi:hypothetical protein